jgi:hypothetical protein
VPVEVRLSGASIDDFSGSALEDFIRATPDLSAFPRLTSHQLRRISMSEVTAKLRTMISDVKELDSSMKVKDAIFLIRTENSEFGFRNARDIKAAIERLVAATIYVNRVNSGDSKPLISISTEMKIPIARARALIAGARRDGFLTADSPGSVGGTLTQRASEFASFLKKNH